GGRGGEGRPAGFPCDPSFVPYPADVGADIAENDRAGLHVPGDLPDIFPTIIRAPVDIPSFPGAAVVAVAAVCAVVPTGEQRTVPGVQFLQLPAVMRYILRGSVGGV